MKHIKKCIECKTYTLKLKCQKCGSDTAVPRPAKFSPEDQYGSYRRRAKHDDLKEVGLL